MNEAVDMVTEPKGIWNYRLIRHREHGHTWYGLHEVYYDKAGKIEAWIEKPDASGDTKDEITRSLIEMLDDLTRTSSMLEAKDMPGNTKKKCKS